jgi:hypothetical protein
VRKITVTYCIRGNVNVPMIRLRGKWLALAGFKEGTFVRIEVVEGRLTLTAAEAEAT